MKKKKKISSDSRSFEGIEELIGLLGLLITELFLILLNVVPSKCIYTIITLLHGFGIILLYFIFTAFVSKRLNHIVLKLN